MSSSPSDADPTGSGLIDRWLAHSTGQPDDDATAPEGEPSVPESPQGLPPTTALSDIAEHPPVTPRSRDTVEAEILAALNRPVTDPEDTTPSSPAPGGDERRARLARMVRTRIDIDPLTAPLAVIESYDDPPAVTASDTVVAPPGEDTDAESTGLQDSDAEPPVPEPATPRHSADRVDTRAVDVFAPLREKVDPDASAPKQPADTSRQVQAPATAPSAEGDRRDAVVLAALDARLSEKDTPEPQATASQTESPAPEPATAPADDPTEPTAVVTPLDALLEPAEAQAPHAARAPEPEAEAEAEPEPEPEAVTEPEPVASREPISAQPRPTAETARVDSTRVDSTRVELTRPRSTQRLLGALLLAAFVGLCLTGWTAWQERTTPTIAVAACLGVLTLVLWSARSTAEPPRMVVENGLLDITRHDTHHRFDLNSNYTPIEVVGTPDRRGWKVQILRRSMPPFVIDSSMVDPHEFTEVLERFRPSAS